MLEMILKMSAVTAVQVLLTVLLWRALRNRTLKLWHRVLVGFAFGCTAVLSTHFGVDYQMMMLNVRDLGPMSAGLFFDPLSGIIAGLIGGIERFIAGTCWGIGSYTTVACSISTCLAGIISAILRISLFKRKNSSVMFAFFIGAVMEVFHMFSILVTHRDDMETAFSVVKICSWPMILFNAFGLALCSLCILLLSGRTQALTTFKNKKNSISDKFRRWLFIVTLIVLIFSYTVSYALQRSTAEQNARSTLSSASVDISISYDLLGINQDTIYEFSNINAALSKFQVGGTGTFDMIDDDGFVPIGDHRLALLTDEEKELLNSYSDGEYFMGTMFEVPSLCLRSDLDGGIVLLTSLPLAEVYSSLSYKLYESVFSGIILFAVLYILISILADHIVVSGILHINESLNRITQGNLDEVVDVNTSTEFMELSNDINLMVASLKGYIEEEQQRMAEELELAQNIQISSLPHIFDTPYKDHSLYALMDPAREVGGDFYDFFLVDKHRLVLVIADVSGKGIPAAMFMMRSKTSIRSLAGSGSSPSEIMFKANNELCEGNDAEMFITVWIGIIDLNTGLMTCANAGHEYPVFMKSGEKFRLLKDHHDFVLAGLKNVRFQEYELQFQPGDRLFVYTDGVPEAVNNKKEQYGSDRLVNALNRLKDLPPENTVFGVREDIRAFSGNVEQFDDITLLEFIYFGKGGGE